MLASNIENKRMGRNQEKIFPFTALVLFVVVCAKLKGDT